MTVTSNSCDHLLTESYLRPSFPPIPPLTPPDRRPADTGESLWTGPLGPNILPGTCIGKYEVQEQLNRGGQATVFRAWDTQLQRDVVIKLGHPPVGTDSAAFSRIMQEGATLARIDHPGLAKVYDCGTVEGTPYLVLEYLRGTNLQQFAAQNSLSRRQIVQFLEEISSAVAAAHEAGILHLDLKPENVMVTSDGHSRLIDFGLAWRMDFPSTTVPPMIAGTREFLSPEQASGDPQRWTEATDVFGLGGLLCQLLTEAPPLSADWLAPETLPDQLSAAVSRLTAQAVDPHLGRLCRRALSLDPEDRFASMREFRRALHPRQRLGERLVASLFILAGLFLLCLGSGVFQRPGSRGDDPEIKDFSRSRLMLLSEARLTLKVEVQTPSDQSPQLIIWSPSLGLREVSGLKREGTGEQSRWYPRTVNGLLSLQSTDEILCVMAFDSSLNRDRRQAIFNQHQLEELLARFKREDVATHRTSGDFLFTSRTRISPDLRQNIRLKSTAAQLNAILEELNVPFQCMLLTRSVHHQPHWELDLFLQLQDQNSGRPPPDSRSGRD